MKQKWETLDFVVHAIGFSDKNELRGKFVDTTIDNFLMTMNISVYSFIAVAQRARAMMKPGGSLLTLSYYGAEKVIPHYNVMGVAKAGLETSVKYLAMDLGPEGIRVNAISAGPIKTLAASGIGDFRYIMKWNEYNSPLRRNVTIEDVGGAGLYLLSDLSSGVTGEIHHVDAGYNVVGMKAEDAPDIATVQCSRGSRRRCGMADDVGRHVQVTGRVQGRLLPRLDPGPGARAWGQRLDSQLPGRFGRGASQRG